MEDQGYTNRYVDVHRLIKVFKDRLHQVNQNRADLREDRLVRESDEMEVADKEIKS